MIYTIGNRASYRACYAEHLAEGTPEAWVKLGKSVDYPGGSVWQFRDEAQDCVNEQARPVDWEVFGVLAGWEQDTYSADEGSRRSLLRDATLIILDRQP